MPHQTDAIVSADRALGFGTTPTERLQSWIPTGPHDWVAWMMFVVHTAWFIIPGVLTLYLIFHHWDDLPSYAIARTGLLFAAVIFFVFLAVEPPWMALGVPRLLTGTYTAPLARADPNPLAAFPSLHVAVPAVQAMWLWSKRMRRLAYAFAAFTLLTIFMSIYTGEHYLIDAIGGVALAYVMVRLSAVDFGRVVNHSLRPVGMTQMSTDVVLGDPQMTQMNAEVGDGRRKAEVGVGARR